MLCPPHDTITRRIAKMRVFREGGPAIDRTTCRDCGLVVSEVQVEHEAGVIPFTEDDWAWFGRLFASGKRIIAPVWSSGEDEELKHPPNRATGHWHRVVREERNVLAVCEEPHHIATTRPQ